MARRKTPQEKKQLSYELDGRNAYGENDKASRKNVPLSKQRAAQAYRASTKQALDGVLSGADPDEAEARVRGVRSKGTGISTAWRKSPDISLRRWLQRQKNQ
jgi:hypothetical protein